MHSYYSCTVPGVQVNKLYSLSRPNVIHEKLNAKGL